VTLNPEIVVQAQADPALADALRAADLSVADGVGIAWAARRSGAPLPGRVPGVDLALEVMRLGSSSLRVYFLGSRPGVAERAAAAASSTYGVVVAGAQHGFFDKSSPEQVLRDVEAARPDLLLAGLGEGQELFLHRHAAQLGAGVMIGVGGTLDVLAGEVKRMPAWTTELGVEWLFRVALDRRRWGRLPRLFKFAGMVLRGS
jgi:N-acetylglucosaminyldiphosphoundecaprenol N-acetyl-beta-D-mannosaminyltransferase